MKNTLHFKIMGMHCVTCATQLERAILCVKGIKSVTVNFMTEKASIEIDDFSETLVKDILLAIEKTGYKAQLIQEASLSYAHHDIVNQAPAYRDLFISIFFTLPLVFHMVGFNISPYIQLSCASVVQFWGGRFFYKTAWRSLRHFSAGMDLLVILGTSVAYGYSFVAVLIHSPDLYFEASSVVITLVLLGRLLEEHAKRSANAVVKSLVKLIPPAALVEKEGIYVEIPSRDIQKGDHIMVKAWQRIPVDGSVFQGKSEVNESMVTGESLPILKEVGDKVIGGTINTSGVLYLKATAVGDQSTLARLIRLVEQAQSSRPPIQKFVDQVSGIFVPVVILVSLLTCGGWLLVNASLQQSFLAAVSVLVVACPCALGLATPTAIVVAMGAAAQKGILIKDLESLEVLRKVDQIVFDKTGTLTKGEFSLTFSESQSGLSQDQLLLLAASLQRGSEHPLAKAFLKVIKEQNLLKIEDFTSLPGKGVQGKINGTLYYMGSEKWMTDLGITVSIPPKIGQTTIYLAEEGRLLGIFRLADIPRRKSFETLRALKAMGLLTVMLTGDNKDIAKEVGKRVGIDEVVAQLQPKDKINYVKAQEHHHYRVAMVGDGINDAPALAAATVGFAMGSGTDTAMDAAPIILMRPSLELIPQAFLLSKRTFRIIQQNLFWAFIFNIFGIGFAAFGHLSPEIAGAAMAASSVLVITNSLRLKRG